MSEFSQHQLERVNQLEHLFNGIQNGENLSQLVQQYQPLIGRCVGMDVIVLVDRLVERGVPMAELKKTINKLLNLLYKSLSEQAWYPPEKGSYLACLVENNRVMKEKLSALKPLFRKLNDEPKNAEVKSSLLSAFKTLESFVNHFLIKENVLFPVIEKYLPEYRCLSVMWSFHDDIKRNLRSACEELGLEQMDMKHFNRTVGKLFFNMLAIKFREERLLFPVVQQKVPPEVLDSLFTESNEIGFPFYRPETEKNTTLSASQSDDRVDLGTGLMTPEQIRLLFNHLPVDVTYVDENDKVVYFSSPGKKVFPRSKAVIGRDVHNCHPPESVHMVHQIVEAFRSGKKNEASFWINMKGQRILIRYFAVRDEAGNYRGVVEVTQEISEIQNLEGEKRLLDWKD